jgi:hypothetical protein
MARGQRRMHRRRVGVQRGGEVGRATRSPGSDVVIVLFLSFIVIYRHFVASNCVLRRVLARIHGRSLGPPYHLKSAPLPTFFSTQHHESVYLR